MTDHVNLAAVRKRYPLLDALPETVRIPAFGSRRDEIVRAIEDASVDDIAFALTAIEAEFSAVVCRLDALRRLYSLARKAGGAGSDSALSAISIVTGDR